ncbi:4Fe-4S binding protein [Poseidonibacter antarcticus]|uniref:4Fe-4S binding protein n=1 Tax=Poseidonibacter antarcticus TaxID=2478538 RepID=UPI000EF4501F|nr:4Fe-4S binding protein [Poseidonibacter antarcticus]
MVKNINRDKNDIFSMFILKTIFKNQIFIKTVQVLTFGLFIYAITFGFINPEKKDNLFTTAVFWSLFWPFFMVVSLSTFGRIFCGICPHAFIGKFITKIGLKKKMPKNLANPFIGVFLLVIGWWLTYYLYPGLFKTPYMSAVFFLVLTLVAILFYFIYDEMAYCKNICPIGTMTKAFSIVSFTKLETYTDNCKSCKTFECASACSYNLKPFTFAKKNSMDDCTLCMDCTKACDAISFKIIKPSSKSFKNFKTKKVEVWAIILITAVISLTMSFHHALGRSAIVEDFFWVKTARYFESFINFGTIDAIGFFAVLYAVLIAIILSTIGMFIASKIMNVPYEKVFYTLGYAFAPLFIIGGLSHIGEFFFYSYASNIFNGFNQAFALGYENIKPLATRRDSWVHIFALFSHLGYIWAFVLMVKRLKLIDAKKHLKFIAFPFASLLIIFYMALNFYTGYVFKTYGAKKSGHNHSSLELKIIKEINNGYRIFKELS